MSNTDTLHFADTQANATITTNTATHQTTVSFADTGQTVTFNGIHQAVTFYGDPSIHFI
jgi:hypothetical protein